MNLLNIHQLLTTYSKALAPFMPIMDVYFIYKLLQRWRTINCDHRQNFFDKTKYNNIFS